MVVPPETSALEPRAMQQVYAYNSGHRTGGPLDVEVWEALGHDPADAPALFD